MRLSLSSIGFLRENKLSSKQLVLLFNTLTRFDIEKNEIESIKKYYIYPIYCVAVLL